MIQFVNLIVIVMIHIIVPVHNRSRITNKFADCLLIIYQNYNFILVDDGSTDDMVKIIKKNKKFNGT